MTDTRGKIHAAATWASHCCHDVPPKSRAIWGLTGACWHSVRCGFGCCGIFGVRWAGACRHGSRWPLGFCKMERHLSAAAALRSYKTRNPLRRALVAIPRTSVAAAAESALTRMDATAETTPPALPCRQPSPCPYSPTLTPTEPDLDRPPRDVCICRTVSPSLVPTEVEPDPDEVPTDLVEFWPSAAEINRVLVARRFRGEINVGRSAGDVPVSPPLAAAGQQQEPPSGEIAREPLVGASVGPELPASAAATGRPRMRRFQGRRLAQVSPATGNVPGSPLLVAGDPCQALVPFVWQIAVVLPLPRGTSKLPQIWAGAATKRCRDFEQYSVLGLKHEVFIQLEDEMGSWMSVLGRHRYTDIGLWLQQKIRPLNFEWGNLCTHVERQLAMFFQLRHISDRWTRLPNKDRREQNAIYYAFALAAENMPDWAVGKRDTFVGSCWHVLWAVSEAGRLSLPSFGPAPGTFSLGLACHSSLSSGKSRAPPTNVFGDGLFHRLVFRVAVRKRRRTAGKLIVPHEAVWLRGMWVALDQCVHALGLASLSAHLKRCIPARTTKLTATELNHAISGVGTPLLHLDAAARTCSAWACGGSTSCVPCSESAAGGVFAILIGAWISVLQGPSAETMPSY